MCLLGEMPRWLAWCAKAKAGPASLAQSESSLMTATRVHFHRSARKAKPRVRETSVVTSRANFGKAVSLARLGAVEMLAMLSLIHI